MTYDQLEGVLWRLSAAVAYASSAMEEVHVVMGVMKRERRSELRPNEWDGLKPILELTKAMVGEEVALQAVEARDKKVEKHKMNAPVQGYVTDEVQGRMKEDRFRQKFEK